MRISSLGHDRRTIGCIFILMFLHCGCATLTSMSAFVPAGNNNSWKVDSSHSYKYPPSGGMDFYHSEYVCGNDTLHAGVIFLGGWHMMGPPLIPLIPGPVPGEDSIFIYIYASTGDKHS